MHDGRYASSLNLQGAQKNVHFALAAYDSNPGGEEYLAALEALSNLESVAERTSAKDVLASVSEKRARIKKGAVYAPVPK